MGAYRYLNHPSRVATAILSVNGKEIEAEVALFRFAYKPYLWGWGAEKENQRMHLSSGAAKAAAAWTRERKAGRKLPKYGVNYNRHQLQVPSPSECNVFLTCGHATHLDDDRKYDGAKLVRWVRLPADITEARPPLDTRLTATAVLEYQPKAGEGLGYWVRLADRATGEHQPQWTLCHDAEALLAHAARYGVPAVQAPAEAA